LKLGRETEQGRDVYSGGELAIALTFDDGVAFPLE
jgi:hypothetical protein